MITIKEIESLARLSYLKLTDEEKERLAKEMSDIIAFADEINTCAESGSAVKEQAINYAELREDEVVPSLSNDEILSSAESENGFFAVRRSSSK